MNRRGFLAGILAAGVAPLVMSNGIAGGVLMPVRRRVWAGVDLAAAHDFGLISIFDAGGNLLSTCKGPSSFGGSLVGDVLRTGIADHVRFLAPGLSLREDVKVGGFQFSNHNLCVGQILTISGVRLERDTA